MEGEFMEEMYLALFKLSGMAGGMDGRVYLLRRDLENTLTALKDAEIPVGDKFAIRQQLLICIDCLDKVVLFADEVAHHISENYKRTCNE